MKKILISLAVVGALVVSAPLALGAAQRWHDSRHCWGWTPGKVLDGPDRSSGGPLPMSHQPESFRRAVRRCVELRRAHRSGLFGTLTRGDRAALSCERRWDRLVELAAEGNAAGSFPASFGMSERLDPSSPAARELFMSECVPVRTRELRELGSD